MTQITISDVAARTKWCPFVRHSRKIGGGTNRSAPNGETQVEPYNSCLGSHCMAWRFVGDGPLDDPAFGYCGLAGKP